MEISINGFKTNYQSYGEGRPLIILHGWQSNLERWTPVAEEIAKKGFRVIVPDLPGFGKSDALTIPWNTNKYINWLEGFVSEIGVKDYYLLGHSFGGALASKMAVKHVQDIKKIFLVSAACVRKKTTQKNFLKNIAKIAKIFYFLPYYSFLRKAVYKFIIRKSDYVYVDGIMKETYLNIVGEDLSFHLPFIKVPTVVIWGEKDESTPLQDGQFIAKQIKNSKLIVIPGASHKLNRENAEALVENILHNV